MTPEEFYDENHDKFINEWESDTFRLMEEYHKYKSNTFIKGGGGPVMSELEIELTNENQELREKLSMAIEQLMDERGFYDDPTT